MILVKKPRVYLHYLLIVIFYNVVKFTSFLLPFILGSPKKFNTSRLPLIKKLIKKHFKKKINVLEVGTHYGLGSTQTIINCIPKHSSLTCIDMWSHKIITKYDYLLPFLSTIINTADKKNINVIKANSVFMSNLKKNSYDLIYLDGSHYYQDVLRDIMNAKKLAKKNFSIICGDDCELANSKENYKIAKSLIKKKTDKCLIDGKIFHPGVYLAVHNQLKNVIIENGFWYCILKKKKT